MRMLTVFAIALSLNAFAGTHKPLKEDKESLQGEWVAIAGVFGKIGLAPQQAGMFRLSVQGDRLTLATEEKKLQGTFTVDAKKELKWLDLKSTDQKTKGEVFLGIYALEQNKVKICLSDPGKDRPTDFPAAGKPGIFMYLVLEKQPDAGDAKATSAQDKARLQGAWKLVGATERGLVVPKAKLAEEMVILIFAGDKIVTQNPKDGAKKAMGRYKIDPTKNPKHFDTEQKDWLGKAIYALDGDRLKIGVIDQRTAIQELGGKEIPQETPRPKSFNQGLALIFERHKQ
jgi:uncharacterized protein (TIGR03067 family)